MSVLPTSLVYLAGNDQMETIYPVDLPSHSLYTILKYLIFPGMWLEAEPLAKQSGEQVQSFNIHDPKGP